MHTDTIYRKYRPTSFSALLGQEKITSILTAQISQEQLAHAYMFTGPRGTGKTSTARIFAKAINCLDWHGDVCNKCANCLLVNEEVGVDIIEIDAASNRGIDEIRKIKEGVNYLPSQLRYKVYIVDEAHMLTKDAFNSLLKTLEEPPQHVIFILATTEPQKVPETILSRVQRYDFRLAEKDIIVGKLVNIVETEGLKVEPKLFDVIFHLSRGSFRDAESLLGKVITHARSSNTISSLDMFDILGVPLVEDLDMLVKLIVNKDKKLLNHIDSILNKGVEPLVLTNELMYFLQDQLVNESVNSKNYLQLLDILNNLSQRYQEIKLGHDSGQLLKLVILANIEKRELLANKLKSANNSPEPSPAKESIDSSQASALNQVVKTELQENIVIENDDQGSLDFQPILNEVARQNPRLGAILSTCQIKDFTKYKLHIATQFMFNYEVLKKMNSKQFILEIAKKVYSSLQIKDIEFEYALNIPEVKAPEIMPKNNEEQVVVSEEEMKPSNEGGVKISSDNKNLVESLL